MPSLNIRQNLTKEPKLQSEVVVAGRRGDKVEVIGQQGDFANVRLVDVPGTPSGWVPKSAVSDLDPAVEPIDKDAFARECWRHSISPLEVNPHYIMAAAQMRSGIANDANGKETGPFRLLQSEWDADWNAAEFGFQYQSADIVSWRSQCALFALMVRRTLDRIGGTEKVSASDLYVAQMVGVKAAAALKLDPSKPIDAVLSTIADSDLPPGNSSRGDLIGRYAKFLKVSGAPATGAQIRDIIDPPLQAAFTATKDSIVNAGLAVLDPDAAPPAAEAIADQRSHIQVGDISYVRDKTGGVIDSWIERACNAAGLAFNDSWLQGFKTLCQRESSFNQNAVNTIDSNAVGPPAPDGNPQKCSRGVAQVIPETFALYHAAGTSVAIYDPVANIAAAMRYVLDRYRVSPDGSDLARKVQQADPHRPPKGY